MSGYGRRRQNVRSGPHQHHPKPRKWRISKKLWGAIVAVAALIGTAFAAGLGESIYNYFAPGGDITRVRNPVGQRPVQVNTVKVKRIADYGTYIFPDALNLSASELKRLDQIHDDSQYVSWMDARGGVDPFVTDIRITVEGNRGHSVLITDVRIAERECTNPLQGTYLYSPSAGQTDTVGIGFNLDEDRPTAQKYDGYNFSGNYFAHHDISLEQGEQQTLTVSAQSKKHYCKFSLELKVVDGKDSHDIPVRNPDANDGKFKVTADLTHLNDTTWETDGFSSYQEVYVGGVVSSKGWREVDPSTYKGSSLK